MTRVPPTAYNYKEQEFCSSCLSGCSLLTRFQEYSTKRDLWKAPPSWVNLSTCVVMYVEGAGDAWVFPTADHCVLSLCLAASVELDIPVQFFGSTTDSVTELCGLGLSK